MLRTWTFQISCLIGDVESFLKMRNLVSIMCLSTGKIWKTLFLDSLRKIVYLLMQIAHLNGESMVELDYVG